MKKLILVFLVALAIVSCQKKQNETANPATQDVTFSVTEITPDLKSTDDWECKADVPTHARVIINGVNYYPELFELDGQLYTQAIKLPVDVTYCIEDFILYKEIGGDGYDKDVDIVVFGTPHTGSEYAVYVDKPVGDNCENSFTVTAFTKAELNIQVLCFQDAQYDYFGFDWFAITEIVIREQCFFGDFCIKNTDDYVGSWYETEQSTGLQIDMPAIFKIMAYKNDVLVPYNETFTNANDEHGWGVGYTVCVQYPDNLSIDGEKFRFELWIYVAVGDDFDYVKFHEWEFEDDEMITTMNEGESVDDGVVDFVLGNCNLSSTNLQLPPYMNLPPTCTLRTGPGVPGTIAIQNGIGGYFDVTLSNIPVGYEISNMGYGVNCFNRGVTINLNTSYDMNVYSSLYPEFMQGPCAGLNWDQANWLINHLDDYVPYTWYEVQQAFWKIEDNNWNFAAYSSVPSGVGTKAPDMAADAIANGDGFVPLPGGWAGVAFERISPPAVQCVFVRVDP